MEYQCLTLEYLKELAEYAQNNPIREKPSNLIPMTKKVYEVYKDQILPLEDTDDRIPGLTYLGKINDKYYGTQYFILHEPFPVMED